MALGQGDDLSQGGAPESKGARLGLSILDNPKLEELNRLQTERRRREGLKKFEKYGASYSPDFVHPKTGEKDGYHKHRSIMSAKAGVSTAMAANRVGKTLVGAFITTCHATGNYPRWWKGKRFTEPTSIWVAGITSESTRDIVQLELLGDVATSLGSGMIPFDSIIGTKRKQGSTDAIDVVYVRHISGGISVIKFKSMEQGRSAFQGTAKHFIWLDEEPDREAYDIYSECNTRTMTTGGQVLLTFTPLKGMSELSKWMLDHKSDTGYSFVNMTWDDAPHLGELEKAEYLAKLKPHEIEARTMGIPTFKEGLIYQTPDSEVLVDPFPVPRHWPVAMGMDIGWTAPTAAILLAQDPKSGIWYVVWEYAEEATSRSDHAKKLRERGEWIYIACDPSANRTESDGQKTMKVYKDLGLNIHNAINDVELGIDSVNDGFSSGMLKIFKSCKGLIEERRFYQFEKGKVRKKDDHRLDGLRYVWMSRDKARSTGFFLNEWTRKKVGVKNANTWTAGDPIVGY